MIFIKVGPWSTINIVGHDKSVSSTVKIISLRKPGEDLPGFIAAKRVGSYGNEATFTVL
jgi:hypothetical protein